MPRATVGSRLRSLGVRPWLQGAALAVAALLLLGIRDEIPAGFWRPEDGPLHWWSVMLLVAATLTAGGAAFFGPIQRALRTQDAAVRAADLERAERMRAGLRIAFRRIAASTTTHEWTDFGLAAYVVARPADSAVPIMQQVASVSFVSRSPTGIVWTRGKGVVGRCWETEQDEAINLASHRVRQAIRSRSAWNGLPEAIRMQLTFDEIRSVNGYGAVVAVPIVSSDPFDRRVLGVLSVHGPHGSFDHLKSRPVRLILHETGVLLEDELTEMAASPQLGLPRRRLTVTGGS